MALPIQLLFKMKTIKIMNLYTIRGQPLGEGGFGIIYLCTEIATGKHYACKCIPKGNLVLQEEYKLVQCEIDILEQISLKDHPNIVYIKDLLEDDDYAYIVMELCDGETVYDHMVEYGPFDEHLVEYFDEPSAAQMIMEIASALEACHSCGIVHRDLKLENLLFQTKDKGAAIKVIDFGLAQFFKHNEVLTDIVGTPPYMAPEFMKRAHGPKVDIWSLGVILYVLLAGFAPFNGCTFEDIYKDILKRRKNHDLFVKDPWPSISMGAKDLIKKMLTYNVDERLSASRVLKHPWILEMSSRGSM